MNYTRNIIYNSEAENVPQKIVIQIWMLNKLLFKSLDILVNFLNLNCSSELSIFKYSMDVINSVEYAFKLQ